MKTQMRRYIREHHCKKLLKKIEKEMRNCQPVCKLWNLKMFLFCFAFQPPSIEDFTILKPISRGAFGYVWITLWLVSKLTLRVYWVLVTFIWLETSVLTNKIYNKILFLQRFPIFHLIRSMKRFFLCVFFLEG